MNNYNYPDAIRNRYNYVMLHEVVRGNPNGDPDQDNRPRLDAATGHGFTSAVSTKSHIRQEASVIKGDDPRFKMYIQSGVTLNNRDEEALVSVCGDEDPATFMKKHPEFVDSPLAFMCKNYWDIRTFGGVMTKFSQVPNTTANVRGPVQVSMGESVSPITITDLSITRKCVATEKEAKSTFGSQYVVPYGLYMTTISIDPVFALRDTGFDEEDLQLLLDSIVHMYEHEASASRPVASVRGLFEFKHDSIYGNASPHTLYERVKINPLIPEDQIRRFEDYEISIDLKNLPNGVTFRQIV